ncbi:MAG: substrate-binding domain-containing protein [Ruminiclostridium sp.]|nr:substrate-binding domain-containing protein [Ruminiclostridium sp.]
MFNKEAKEKNSATFKARTIIITLVFSLCIILLATLLIFIFSTTTGTTGNITGAAWPKQVYMVLMALSVILSAVLLYTSLKFFSSLTLINSNAKKMSEGELNISDIPVDKTKGLEALTIAFNDMKSNLLSFIEMTKGNVIVLSDSIDKVLKSIDMTCQGNEQIAGSITHVAEKAMEQLSIVNQTIESIEGIGNRVDGITSNIANFEKYIDTTVTVAQEGTDNLERFYSQLNTISDNMNITFEFFGKLNTEIAEITEVGEFIIKISEQLKLLGINASVEAAKAGEFSKGFTVIANEINQLGTKTKEGIKRITGIVGNIVKGSDILSKNISGCVDSFNASKETFNSVKESFYTINNQSSVLTNNMKNIYTEINQINSFTKQTNAKGYELHTASNEISTKTQEIAAVTEQELAELHEIRQNTLSLNNMLAGIQNLIIRYNTSLRPVEQSSAKKMVIAFLAPMDHSFWLSIRQGVLYAQMELANRNTVVEYHGMPAGYTEDQLIEIFKNCIAKGYDGYVVPGFFQNLIPIVNSLTEKGIPVMGFNCDFPKGTKRLAYYGPDTYLQGFEAGNMMKKALSGKGNVLMVGRLEIAGLHLERLTGFEAALKSSKNIKIAGKVFAEDTYETVYRAVKGHLENDNNIDGIFVAGGGPTGAVKAIVEAGLQDQIRVVCFDRDKDVLQGIRDGIIYASIGQDPFGQGHDPVIYLYNYLVTGQKPQDTIPARSDIVNAQNVDDLIEL